MFLKKQKVAASPKAAQAKKKAAKDKNAPKKSRSAYTYYMEEVIIFYFATFSL